MECWQWVGGQRPEEAEPGPSWRSPVASVAKRPRYSLSGKQEGKCQTQSPSISLEHPSASRVLTKGAEKQALECMGKWDWGLGCNTNN